MKPAPTTNTVADLSCKLFRKLNLRQVDSPGGYGFRVDVIKVGGCVFVSILLNDVCVCVHTFNTYNTYYTY